jgi:hypothetical protein
MALFRPAIFATICSVMAFSAQAATYQIDITGSVDAFLIRTAESFTLNPNITRNIDVTDASEISPDGSLAGLSSFLDQYFQPTGSMVVDFDPSAGYQVSQVTSCSGLLVSFCGEGRVDPSSLTFETRPAGSSGARLTPFTLTYVDDGAYTFAYEGQSWFTQNGIDVTVGVDSFSISKIDIAPVPLPASSFMLLAAFLGLGAFAKMRRNVTEAAIA